MQNSLNSFNITDAYNNSSRTGSSPSDSQSRGGGTGSFSDSPHNQVESVLALYSYVSEKPYSLPLQKGDVINVISKLPSGWWDGVNAKGQRGWFPSNFTQPLPKQPPPATTASQEPTTTSSSTNDTGSSSVSSFPPRLSDGLVPTNESIDPFTQSTPSHLGLSPAMNNGIMTFEINENDEYDTNQKFDDPTASSVQTIPHKSEFHKAKQHTSVDDFDDTSSINSSYHSPSRRGSAQSSNSYLGSSSEQLRKLGSSDPSAGPPSGDYLNSYKLVDAKTQEYGTSNPHWIPQVSANGKICYVNPEKKHVAADLPFTPVDTASTNDSEKVVQTMKVSAEVSEQPCNIPNLSEQPSSYQDTYAVCVLSSTFLFTLLTLF